MSYLRIIPQQSTNTNMENQSSQQNRLRTSPESIVNESSIDERAQSSSSQLFDLTPDGEIFQVCPNVISRDPSTSTPNPGSDPVVSSL
jgi:hypothetical protein